jgi:hypothetical protein
MKNYVVILLINFIIGIRFDRGEDEYIDNSDVFLSSHSNRENFIAMFSNFTKINGEGLYQSYIQATYKKGPQYVIDKMNNIGSKNVDKWEYDTNLKKFKLSEESKHIIT